MTRATKGGLILVILVLATVYFGSGTILGFDNVHEFLSLKKQDVRAEAFLNLSTKDMERLILKNVDTAERGADGAIENILMREEQLARIRAQRQEFITERDGLREMLTRAVAWAKANPGGVYKSPDGKEYSFAQITADVAQKTQRLKAVEGFIVDADGQISQYEKYILDANTKVNEYLASVVRLKNKATLEMTDLSLRREIEKSFSDLGSGKKVSADSFKDVEGMLAAVQNELRTYKAVDSREDRVKKSGDLTYGVAKTPDVSVIDEAESVLKGAHLPKAQGLSYPMAPENNQPSAVQNSGGK